MNQSGGIIVSEFKKYKVYFFIALASLLMLYFLDLVLDKDLVVRLNCEDNLFENLTVMAFFLTTIVFLILYSRTRKLIVLLFALVFLFGTGEEISWGQRLFNYHVPEKITACNTQHEFNIHNLKALSSTDSNGIKKGISRYMTIGAFYLLFCFFYGILQPGLLMRIGFVRRIVERMGIPVPPFIIGIFFLVNYGIFKSLGHVNVMGDSSVRFYLVIDESFECGSAFIFLLISISFLQNIKKRQKTIHIRSESNLINAF